MKDKNEATAKCAECGLDKPLSDYGRVLVRAKTCKACRDDSLRTCKTCGKRMPISKFYKVGKYRRHVCKACVKEENHGRYLEMKKDPERYDAFKASCNKATKKYVENLSPEKKKKRLNYIKRYIEEHPEQYRQSYKKAYDKRKNKGAKK